MMSYNPEYSRFLIYEKLLIGLFFNFLLFNKECHVVIILLITYTTDK
jgi:hypothetical protein